MEDKELKQDNLTITAVASADSNAIQPINLPRLKQESLDILNQLIAESDQNKAQDLTYLFNMNQNKKTMVRINKLNELLDTMADSAIDRFSKKPDEISNMELLNGLKIVNEMIERGQKQVTSTPDSPLIQVNQQTNEVNINGEKTGQNLNRDSRERVKTAVLSLLNGLSTEIQDTIPVNTTEVEFEDKDGN